MHCDTSEEVDAAKHALRETGARDIAASGEAASDTSGGHNTFGNISTPSLTTEERLTEAEREDELAAAGRSTRY